MASRSAVARRALGARLGDGRETWLRRAAVFGAPAAYLVALTLVTVSWGLPVARDQLFIWLVAGIAAFSVPAWRGWGGMLLEWLPFFGLLAAYDYLRGAVSVTRRPGARHPADRLRPGAVLGPRAHGLAPAAPVGREPRALVRLRGLERLHDALLRRVGDGRDPLALRGASASGSTRPPRSCSASARSPPTGPIRRSLRGWRPTAASSRRSTASCPRSGATSACRPLSRPTRTAASSTRWPPCRRCTPPSRSCCCSSSGRRAAGCGPGLGLYTLAMGFTLVYGGEHFVIDIVAGWAMALGVHALVSVGFRRAPALSSARSRAR